MTTAIRSAIVTGGLGFIGSHLTDRLLKDGVSVTVIDNLATGRESNLKHQSGNSKLKIHKGDVSLPGDWGKLFSGIDAVFHLAALADIVPSIQKPMAYYQANVTGTALVLEAARVAQVKRFLYVASSSCYGIPDTTPTPEITAIKPEYPYALTKYLGECLALHWSRVYDLPVVSTRLFNVYGPRSRTTGAYGAVFGVFLAQKLSNKPLTVVGDGTQTRDFTFVSDVVDALVHSAKSDAKGEIFNVGSGKTVSVNRLVELIGGAKAHIPKRPGEPDSTFADISKIKKQLGWNPKVSIEEGVKTMMDHIADWKDAPVWTPDSIADATKDWFRYLAKEKV